MRTFLESKKLALEKQLERQHEPFNRERDGGQPAGSSI